MRLIIVDGLDAVGKDTQAQLIAHYYQEKGESVVIRSHPAVDNFFGRCAKDALIHSGMKNKVKASVFYMFDVLRSIRKYYHPHQQGTIIMVRYLMGTAYLPKRTVKFGYTFFERFVPTSPYMFFLDAAPDVLLERIKERKEQEIFETYDALIKVRDKALLLVDHWHVIDTSGTIEDTFLKMKTILKELDAKC
ncbi:MAG: thymidylate kinase [Thermoplasmatota archaeon]